MKKLYTLLLFYIPFFAFAQITIIQSDLPGVGSFYLNATDSGYNAAITPGGAAQSWNYATLQNIVQDTLGFISSAGTPYLSNFPGANLAGFDPGTGAYAYFTSNATGLYINGGQSPAISFPLIYNPPQTMIHIPFTYNDNYSDYYRFQIDSTVSGIPYRYVQYFAQTILADGYGSLALPNGTHPNTLRLKFTRLQIDSIYINVPFGGWIPLPGYTPTQHQTTIYRWVQNGSGTLLAEITADSLGQTATSSSYLLLYGVVGINHPIAKNNSVVYPSPAKDILNLDFGSPLKDNAELVIISASGMETGRYNLNNLEKLSISTSAFRNGTYFYTVYNGKEIASRGAFEVIK